MDKIKRLQEMIDECSDIVFFGGAGVSTESNIPDFRSTDGLYNQRYRYKPEYMLCHDFFMSNTEEFYNFYREKMIFTSALPNKAHLKLAELENAGKLSAVITQNIDNLHSLAGSKQVYELHGSVYRNYCMKCGKFYDVTAVTESSGIPRCSECGGIIKPDVVLYQEPLDDSTLKGAAIAISRADMMIIGGTSLNVYPAAGMVKFFDGKYLVLINKSPTSCDSNADLVINDSIGKVLDQIKV